MWWCVCSLCGACMLHSVLHRVLLSLCGRSALPQSLILIRQVLQHTATYCTTLFRTATHRTTLQHTASHCNTLQHTATHCNTLQHTATHCNCFICDFVVPLQHCNLQIREYRVDCNTLQLYCNTKIDKTKIDKTILTAKQMRRYHETLTGTMHNTLIWKLLGYTYVAWCYTTFNYIQKAQTTYIIFLCDIWFFW